jgi:hypothetical protein
VIGVVCGLTALAVILIAALIRPELYARHTGDHTARAVAERKRAMVDVNTPSQAYRLRLRAAVVARQQAVADLTGKAVHA